MGLPVVPEVLVLLFVVLVMVPKVMMEEDLVLRVVELVMVSRLRVLSLFWDVMLLLRRALTGLEAEGRTVVVSETLGLGLTGELSPGPGTAMS